MVQYRGVYYAGGIHFWQRGPEHRVWTGTADLRSRVTARVRDDRDNQGAGARRGIQRPQSLEPRNSEPFRQHAPVRHDHGSRDTGTRNPVRVTSVFLENRSIRLLRKKPDRDVTSLRKFWTTAHQIM